MVQALWAVSNDRLWVIGCVGWVAIAALKRPPTPFLECLKGYSLGALNWVGLMGVAWGCVNRWAHFY
jgi:hypothetical protein